MPFPLPEQVQTGTTPFNVEELEQAIEIAARQVSHT
jgi:hypothetical protein